MVKMVANMHGNEPVGREVLVHLAKYILRFDREILETTDLYILPTMNPDGFDRAFEGRCDGITYSAGRLSEGIVNRGFKAIFFLTIFSYRPDYNLQSSKSEPKYRSKA